MGLFDGYFDPDQFQDSGGLFGRLLSLHPELDFSQTGAGGDPQIPFAGSAFAPQASSPPGALQRSLNSASAPFAAAAPSFDPTRNVAAPGDSLAPPPADANVLPPAPAFDFGAHLNAGFQKWAQTPVGNPFAALANGIAGFNAVQPTDAAFIGPPAPAPAQTPDLSDRLGAALQSWTHTPVGSPVAALANGINGFNTGQTSVAPAASSPLATGTLSDASDPLNAAARTPATPPFANPAPLWPPRRQSIPRRWP
jgi:hypothetical protein